MKYCIIGMPRSRSSVLLETISLYYNIPILGKEIEQIRERWHKGYFLRLNQYLSEYSTMESGILRLHPLHLAVVPPHFGPTELNTAKDFTLVDLNLLNFKQYDKIFITVRDSIVDNIASNIVANKLNRYTYKSQKEIVRNIDPIHFSKDSHRHVFDVINGLKILEIVKTYLNANNIEYETLSYDDIPNYLATNYPNTKTFHVETNYNYSKLIDNYKDLEIFYHELIKNK